MHPISLALRLNFRIPVLSYDHLFPISLDLLINTFSHLLNFSFFQIIQTYFTILPNSTSLLISLKKSFKK